MNHITDTSLILSSTHAGVCQILMNRPDRFNAINGELDAALRHAFRSATADTACRAIVLSGVGKGFCSGADREASSMQSPDWDAIPETLERFRFAYLTQCPKPTIASINGAAIGVGLVLACLCDFRIVADHAKLSFPYSQLGLIAEYGIASRLASLIGTGKATELLVTGRQFSARQASDMGLVTQAVEASRLDATVQALAGSLALENSPSSMAAIKRQLNAIFEREFLDSTAMAGTELSAARLSRDYAEAKLARAEGRHPIFSGH
ncbi:MAG: enoyl-CoA hydratase/isomerase family protein [Comamonadaceae bacterium]|nr:enoyl-CoA hydratase/isomerase family protein [Comamonadaceae bacterium]